MYWLYLICIVAGIYRGFTRDTKNITHNTTKENHIFECAYLLK